MPLIAKFKPLREALNLKTPNQTAAKLHYSFVTNTISLIPDWGGGAPSKKDRKEPNVIFAEIKTGIQ